MKFIFAYRGQAVMDKTKNQAPHDIRHRIEEENLRWEDADANRNAYILTIVNIQDEIWCKCRNYYIPCAADD